MKNLFLFTCLLLPFFIFAKEHKQPYIAFSYSEFVTPKHDNNIKDVYSNSYGKIVVKIDTGKLKYPLAKVWGYIEKDGTGHRIYKEDIYEIAQIDTITLYKRKIGGKYRHTHYYFSQGLAGDIHSLGTKELKKVYGQTNPAFLTHLKKDLKWHEDYEKYDNKAKVYKIIEIYKKTIS